MTDEPTGVPTTFDEWWAKSVDTGFFGGDFTARRAWDAATAAHAAEVTALRLESNARFIDLQAIFAATNHVGMGKTAPEVCDKVIRASDRIVALQDELTELRRIAGELAAALEKVRAYYASGSTDDFSESLKAIDAARPALAVFAAHTKETS